MDAPFNLSGAARSIANSELLSQGARLLYAARQPVHVQFYREGWGFTARFDWPGIVTIFSRDTGEQVTQSLVGYPTMEWNTTLDVELGADGKRAASARQRAAAEGNCDEPPARTGRNASAR